MHAKWPLAPWCTGLRELRTDAPQSTDDSGSPRDIPLCVRISLMAQTRTGHPEVPANRHAGVRRSLHPDLSLSGGIDSEQRWLAPITESRDKGAHRPLKTVSGTIDGPSNAELLLDATETLVCHIFKTLDGVRCGSIPFDERGVALRHHSLAALVAGIPRRVTDDHRSVAFYASKCLG